MILHRNLRNHGEHIITLYKSLIQKLTEDSAVKKLFSSAEIVELQELLSGQKLPKKEELLSFLAKENK